MCQRVVSSGNRRINHGAFAPSMAVLHWAGSTPSYSTTSTMTRRPHRSRTQSAQRRGHLPETRCCITGPSARTITIPTVPRTSRCLCLGGVMKMVMTRSTRVTAISTITSTAITLTIIITITKASGAAIWPPNKNSGSGRCLLIPTSPICRLSGCSRVKLKRPRPPNNSARRAPYIEQLLRRSSPAHPRG